jgi:hypothetical protein
MKYLIKGLSMDKLSSVPDDDEFIFDISNVK